MTGIFHAYDIRGVYPQEISEEIAYKIGRVFVQFLQLEGKDVIVGRDNRLSSPSLRDALVDGMLTQGANVVNIGLCTTPMFYFAIANYKYPAGVMITASHLPKQFNGLKLCKENAIPIGEENGLREIEKLVESNKFFSPTRKGVMKKRDVLQEYVNHVHAFCHDIKPLSVAADTANGMVGLVLPHVLAQLPLKKVVPLYFELDGNYPHHEANPIKAENVVDLQRAVVENGCDVGMSFDADGDRVVFIDEKGQRVPPDLAGALLSETYLATKPGQGVVYDVRSSWAVREYVKQLGGKPILSRAGRSRVQQVMREQKAVFGMERTGHYFFKDNFFMDSALVAAMKMLTLLSATNKPLSELLKPLKQYYHSDELNFSVADREAVLKRVEEYCGKAGATCARFDGITVEFHDWWFNLRQSETEPVVRLNVEAKTEELLKRKVEELKKLILA